MVRRHDESRLNYGASSDEIGKELFMRLTEIAHVPVAIEESATLTVVRVQTPQAIQRNSHVIKKVADSKLRKIDHVDGAAVN
jgi:hypothetical protein